jgi:hypothetical protein
MTSRAREAASPARSAVTNSRSASTGRSASGASGVTTMPLCQHAHQMAGVSQWSGRATTATSPGCAARPSCRKFAVFAIQRSIVATDSSTRAASAPYQVTNGRDPSRANSCPKTSSTDRCLMRRSNHASPDRPDVPGSRQKST